MCKETKGSSCPTRPKSASIQGVGTGACATLKRPKVCQRTGHCGSRQRPPHGQRRGWGSGGENGTWAPAPSTLARETGGTTQTRSHMSAPGSRGQETTQQKWKAMTSAAPSSGSLGATCRDSYGPLQRPPPQREGRNQV